MAEELAERVLEIPQTDPPRSPRETLPSMYDLPSEDPKEPGLPDEFHLIQPQLLRETFRPAAYEPDRFFVASDLNLYYQREPTWYKRPDWFAALGVSRFYRKRDLRLSYVTWQEEANPYLVIELLSQGTEKEDLGETENIVDQPPTKWTVYEQILRIPYYVVFSRYTDEVRYFELVGDHYQEQEPPNQRLWLPKANLGLGLWQGTFENIERQWLRFFDANGEWIPTSTEREQKQVEQERQRAEQERQRADQAQQRAEQEQQRAEQEQQRAEQADQRAEQERQRAERLAAQLKAAGIEPE